MKNKWLFILVALGVFSSCGFKSEDTTDGTNETVLPTVSVNEVEQDGDYDGDLVSNKEELKIGRNPYVADIPEIEFKFMKEFSLSSGSKILIDSNTDIVGSKFEYRVGDYLVKDIVQAETSRFARFGGVVEGEFEEVDLSRIRYPKFSKEFLLKQDLNSLVSNNGIKLNFTNSISLKRNRGFQKISNPTFNFHYFDYETGMYELLDQKTIEKGIFEGVLEKFDIQVDSLPQNLLKDNFSKKGEFLTAEIEDFNVDDLNTTYKVLLTSVKERTIPFTVITPLETKTYYVALADGHNKLGHFLKSLYGSNFKVQENELIQIGGFQNSLDEIEELKSLRGETKKGKWFVLVNRSVNFNLFDYEFQKGDQVVLNYMTGNELASYEEDYQISQSKNYQSALNYQDIELGDFGLNDSILVNLTPNYIRYEYYNVGTFGFNDSAGHSSWRFHDQVERKDGLNFSSDGPLNRLGLLVDGKEFKLKQLISENRLHASFKGSSLSLEIKEVFNTFSLTSDDSYKLSLRVYPDNYQADIGLWLESIGGWIAGQSRCGSADSICKGWYNTNGIPVNRICSHVQPSFTNACTGVLKDEYRKRSKTLRRDMNFNYSFLITKRFN